MTHMVILVSNKFILQQLDLEKIKRASKDGTQIYYTLKNTY